MSSPDGGQTLNNSKAGQKQAWPARAGAPVLSSLPGRERAAPRCAFLFDVGVGRRKVSLKLAGWRWSLAGRALRELSALGPTPCDSHD